MHATNCKRARANTRLPTLTLDADTKQHHQVLSIKHLPRILGSHAGSLDKSRPSPLRTPALGSPDPSRGESAAGLLSHRHRAVLLSCSMSPSWPGRSCCLCCDAQSPPRCSCSNSPSWPSRSRCLVSAVTHSHRPGAPAVLHGHRISAVTHNHRAGTPAVSSEPHRRRAGQADRAAVPPLQHAESPTRGQTLPVLR